MIQNSGNMARQLTFEFTLPLNFWSWCFEEVISSAKFYRARIVFGLKVQIPSWFSREAFLELIA
jgi:hypothetical protein